MVDAISEIGDQFQLRPGLADHVGVDLVRQRRHQHIGPRHRLFQTGAVEGLVVQLKLDVEKRIGRASGRERVCQNVWISVVAASLKKKTKTTKREQNTKIKLQTKTQKHK